MLATPKVVNITPMLSGQFWYNGMKNNLQTALGSVKHLTSISLAFNIDGLPIHHSSSTQFWPILFTVFELPRLRPMVAAIY